MIVSGSLHRKEPHSLVVVVKPLDVDLQGRRPHTRVEVKSIRWELDPKPVCHILSVSERSAEGNDSDLSLDLALHYSDATGHDLVSGIQDLHLIEDI